MPPTQPSVTIEQLAGHLARLAPLNLAETWDNVGLLVGDRSRTVDRVITCLTITPGVVAEAVEARVGLIITHHPLPFHALKRITADTTAGRMLLGLISGGVAVYSAHTAFDSAEQGINRQIADRLGLVSTLPLQPSEACPSLGSGRYGSLNPTQSLEELLARVADSFPGSMVRAVGDPRAIVSRVGIACGSGGSLLDAARRRGCECLVTGEANFHACLEAESTGVGLILLGHYASERFAMEVLSQQVADEFPMLRVWASRSERDPLWSTPG